ncbi:MAG TPA: tRNA lysidine(34) synthetase TilS [Nitrospira sp.]|nr:tRNA lysidine(34) synthetase TilS [Nitrospira sp.]
MTTHAPRRRPALLNQVVRTVGERRLFRPGQHLLVAVSGGPDSIALLSLLIRLAPSWHLKLTAVHFNYGLRGSESDADEAFVSTYCHANNIPLVIRRPIITKQRRASSLQSLARRARYEAMKSLARDLGADRIVTGHTANDQAETVLLWLLRGAGLTGLTGMPVIREHIVVRPLLKTTRQDILSYLDQQGLSYRQDSSNLTRLYRRNRIRHDLLPVMEEITPGIVRRLERQADILRADDAYLKEVVDGLYRSLITVDANGKQRFDCEAVTALPVALKRRLLRQILTVSDPDRRAPAVRVVDGLLRALSGNATSFRIALRGTDVIRDRQWVLVMKRHGRHEALDHRASRATSDPVPLAVPSTVYWPGTRQEIHVQEMTRQAAEPWLRRRTRECAVFDRARLSAPLMLRAWRAGDRIEPKGMGGKSKKLQDFFTDSKLSREERSRIPLLVAPEGILWVVGRRENERFVARKSTSRYLVATVQSRAGSEGAE